MGRSDEKTQSKPYVSMVVHEVVGDVRGRYMPSLSAGEVARRITMAALNDIQTIEALSPYFWRTYARGDYEWIGHDNHEDISDLLPDEWTATKRLSIRFEQNEWKRITNLAFALASDKANTISALLTLGTKSERVLNIVVPGYRFRSAYSLRKGVFPRGLA